MKFRYTKFTDHPAPGQSITILRPIIPVGLRSRGKTVPGYSVMIDSGADDCLFHAEIGEALGIDMNSGIERSYSGVGFGELKGRRHPVEIQIGGYWLTCDVTFCHGMVRDHPAFPGMKQGLRYGILGQRGFFDQFKVIFDYIGEEIELRPGNPSLLSLS